MTEMPDHIYKDCIDTCSKNQNSYAKKKPVKKQKTGADFHCVTKLYSMICSIFTQRENERERETERETEHVYIM